MLYRKIANTIRQHLTAKSESYLSSDILHYVFLNCVVRSIAYFIA